MVHVLARGADARVATQNVARLATLAVINGGGAGGALEFASRAGQEPFYLALRTDTAGAIQYEGQGACETVGASIYAGRTPDFTYYTAFAHSIVNVACGADTAAVLDEEWEGADRANSCRGALEAAVWAGCAGGPQ